MIAPHAPSSSPRRRWAPRVAGAVGALLLAAPLAAQEPAPSCDALQVFNMTPPTDESDISRMHPLVARARVVGAVTAQRWSEAIRDLRDGARLALAEGGVTPDAEARFLAELDAVVAAIGALPPEGSAERNARIRDRVQPVRFSIQENIQGQDVLFRGVGDPGLVIAADWPLPQRRALCWSAMSVDIVLHRLSTPLDAAALTRLRTRDRSWSNYRRYGYSKQPLELLLFPGDLREPLPARTQYLVGHLSGGVELGGTLDSLSGSQTVVAELGVLRYRGDWTQYAGVSGIVSIASGSTIGYGALLHFARGMRAGVVLRRAGGDTRESVVVSADLYGLLERSKQAIDRAWAAARAQIVLIPPDR